MHASVWFCVPALCPARLHFVLRVAHTRVCVVLRACTLSALVVFSSCLHFICTWRPTAPWSQPLCAWSALCLRAPAPSPVLHFTCTRLCGFACLHFALHFVWFALGVIVRKNVYFVCVRSGAYLAAVKKTGDRRGRPPSVKASLLEHLWTNQEYITERIYSLLGAGAGAAGAGGSGRAMDIVITAAITYLVTTAGKQN